MPILEVEHISKSFNKTPVLKDVGFNLEKGQAVSIIGSSGSGKTTLLRCLNFLEHPDNGIIRVNGETLFDASVPATTQESVIRKKRLHFGLVFQNFNLFPQYTALENVMLAKKLLAAEQPDFKERKREILTAIEVQAKVLLTQMGLDNRMDNYPHQLSGGQCQRVAIARALAKNPKLLLSGIHIVVDRTGEDTSPQKENRHASGQGSCQAQCHTRKKHEQYASKQQYAAM